MSDTSREQIPGSGGYMNKICTFIESHYNVRKLHMEFLKRACSEHLDGRLCDFSESHPWVGPESDHERIPQPIPDPKNPPHYKSVFCTPVRNDDGSRRDPDD